MAYSRGFFNRRIPVFNRKESSSGEFGYWGNCHLRQIERFYDSVEQGKPVDVTPEDAAETLRVVLSIYQSSKENREIVF